MSHGAGRPAEELYSARKWDEGHAQLRKAIGGASDPLERARLRRELIDRYFEEDWVRGPQNLKARRVEVENLAMELSDLEDSGLEAEASYQRAMTCHLEFVMAADTSRKEEEREHFTRAAELFEADGRTDEAALALAMLGIYHHVVERDRDTAWEILERAYAMTPDDRPTHARFEAARHLGQIRQEKGDPAGALPMLEESRRQADEFEDDSELPPALHALACARLEAGDLEGAERDLVEGRQLAEAQGADFWLAFIAKTESELAFKRLAPGVAGRMHP